MKSGTKIIVGVVAVAAVAGVGYYLWKKKSAGASAGPGGVVGPSSIALQVPSRRRSGPVYGGEFPGGLRLPVV